MTQSERGRAPRGPYAKTPAVRRRILDASLEVFREQGYRAATIKEVAARAEISQRGLVHHYASKEELLAAVIEEYEARSASNAAPVGSAEGVASVVRTALAGADRPGVTELQSVLAAEATAASHPAHGHYVERYGGLRIYLTLAFESLRDEGRLRSTAPAPALANLLIAVLDGLAVQRLYDPSTVDVRASVEVFLGEIGADLDLNLDTVDGASGTVTGDEPVGADR